MSEARSLPARRGCVRSWGQGPRAQRLLVMQRRFLGFPVGLSLFRDPCGEEKGPHSACPPGGLRGGHFVNVMRRV